MKNGFLKRPLLWAGAACLAASAATAGADDLDLKWDGRQLRIVDAVRGETLFRIPSFLPGVQPVWDLPSWTAGNWPDYVEALRRRDEPVHIGRLFKTRDEDGVRDVGPADFVRYRQLDPAPGRRTWGGL